MKKAIFLDRDGTINREVDNLRDLSQLRLLPGVARAIAFLNKMGYLVIVVTNQPVVARGLITSPVGILSNASLALPTKFSIYSFIMF